MVLALLSFSPSLLLFVSSLVNYFLHSPQTLVSGIQSPCLQCLGNIQPIKHSLALELHSRISGGHRALRSAPGSHQTLHCLSSWNIFKFQNRTFLHIESRKSFFFFFQENSDIVRKVFFSLPCQ